MVVRGNLERRRRQGREGTTKGKSKSKLRSKKAVQCYEYKDYGHMKKDCLRLRGKNDNKKNKDSLKSTNVVQNDDSDFEDGDILVVSTNQYMDAWFLDSAASYHMTPNKE